MMISRSGDILEISTCMYLYIFLLTKQMWIKNINKQCKITLV